MLSNGIIERKSRLKQSAEQTPMYWEFEDEDGQLTISGEGAMPDYRDEEERPWEEIRSRIQVICVEKGVTAIGARAFAECDALTEVYLAETVERIGSRAFRDCKKLEIVDSLREFEHLYEEKASIDASHQIFMGMQAFRGTPWCAEKFGDFYISRHVLVEYLGDAKEVVIPEGVRVIGTMAFENLPVEKVVFPASLTEIRSYAFLNTDLKELRIPRTLKKAGKFAFGDTAQLEYVEIADSSFEAEADAFGGSAVEEEVKAMKKGWTSFYGLVTVTETGIAAAKRMEIRKDPKRRVGCLDFDEGAALLKKVKTGTNVLRICFDEKTKTVNFVEAICRHNKEKELFEIHRMHPCEKDGLAGNWTIMYSEDIVGYNTDGLRAGTSGGGTSYHWYQASGKGAPDAQALDLLNEWLKKHPDYRVLT